MSRSGWRSTGCAITSAQSDPAKDGQQRPGLCVLRARAQRHRAARRPALPRRHQARRAEDARSPRRSSPRRSACSATARAPSASTTPALEDIAPQPKLELGRTDYGSSLRDASAFVALASEGNAPRPAILKAVERIEAARDLTPYTSTQENAWMVLAARALARDTAGMALDVAGETKRGALYRSFAAKDVGDAGARHQQRRQRRAGGGVGHRRAGDAGARGRQGLRDRAALLHARRRGAPTSPR